MKAVLLLRVVWLSFLILVQTFDDVDTLEPITTSLAVGTAVVASGLFSFLPAIRSRFFEVCDDNWVAPRLQELRHVLQRDLHGQHVAIDPVLRALQAHLRNPNPSKALVMSFHGWTGSGKNFVSNLIADHLYKKGRNSSFVHLIISTHHFPHASRTADYQDMLRKWIHTSVSSCERSLFIIDEVDKLSEGVLDAIKPYVDHHHRVDGLNFRKSIFILLSNSGGNDIAEITFNHWKAGGKRTELQLVDMEKAIHKAAFNEGGGLRKSSVLDKSLISVYVPFLPMEGDQVKMCIIDELRARGKTPTDKLVQKVLQHLHFVPEDIQLFSSTGCKRVTDKVDLEIDEDMDSFFQLN